MSAFLDGKLPPTEFNIDYLTAEGRKCVQKSELVTVRKFQHLARSIEHSYLHGRYLMNLLNNDLDVFRWFRDSLMTFRRMPDLLQWERESRKPFHQAVYRVLLAGALLSRHSYQPFASDGVLHRLPTEFPANLLRHLEAKCKPENPQTRWASRSLEGNDIEYLRRHLYFNLEASIRADNRNHEFGPFADWLVRTALIGLPKSSLPDTPFWVEFVHEGCDTYEEEVDKELALREVMRMLLVFRHMSLCLTQVPKWRRNGLFGSPSDCTISSILPGDRNRSVKVFFLGGQQLQEIHMRPEVDGLMAVTEIAPQNLSGNAHGLSKFVDVNGILDYLYKFHGPNCFGGLRDSAPHPRLQLFTLILRRCFGLEFAEGTWNPFHEQRDKFSDFYTDASIWRENLQMLSEYKYILANHDIDGRITRLTHERHL
jgi:hypothetical protein